MTEKLTKPVSFYFFLAQFRQGFIPKCRRLGDVLFVCDWLARVLNLTFVCVSFTNISIIHVQFLLFIWHLHNVKWIFQCWLHSWQIIYARREIGVLHQILRQTSSLAANQLSKAWMICNQHLVYLFDVYAIRWLHSWQIMQLEKSVCCAKYCDKHHYSWCKSIKQGMNGMPSTYCAFIWCPSDVTRFTIQSYTTHPLSRLTNGFWFWYPSKVLKPGSLERGVNKLSNEGSWIHFDGVEGCQHKKKSQRPPHTHTYMEVVAVCSCCVSCEFCVINCTNWMHFDLDWIILKKVESGFCYLHLGVSHELLYFGWHGRLCVCPSSMMLELFDDVRLLAYITMCVKWTICKC